MAENKKIPGAGYHHIAIKASDYERSLAFYREGLGFAEAVSWGEGDGRACMLDLGDGNYLELFAGGAPAGRPEGDWIHYCLRTSDCDQAYKAAVDAGATIVSAPNDVSIPSEPPLKIRNCFFKGPDGELLEFFEYK